jgi:hypothetical protein
MSDCLLALYCWEIKRSDCALGVACIALDEYIFVMKAWGLLVRGGWGLTAYVAHGNLITFIYGHAGVGIGLNDEFVSIEDRLIILC